MPNGQIYPSLTWGKYSLHLLEGLAGERDKHMGSGWGLWDPPVSNPVFVSLLMDLSNGRKIGLLLR